MIVVIERGALGATIEKRKRGGDRQRGTCVVKGPHVTRSVAHLSTDDDVDAHNRRILSFLTSTQRPYHSHLSA